MNKGNVFFTIVILIGLFIYIISNGKEEIEGMVQMVFVSEEESVPEVEDKNQVIVLSSEGYEMEDATYRAINGEMYIELEYINEQYAQGRFFFDKAAHLVIYTNSTTIMNCSLGGSYDLVKFTETTGPATFVFVPEVEEESSKEESSDEESSEEETEEEGEESSEEEEVLEELPEGSVYMNAEMLSKMFNLEFMYDEERQILTVQDGSMMRFVDVKESEEPVYLKAYAEAGNPFKTIIGDTKGYEVYRELKAGETLVYYGEEGDYYRVTDMKGLVAYVEKSAVSDVRYEEVGKVELDSYIMPAERLPEGPISVTWDYFYPGGGGYINDYIISEYSYAKEAVNVISPTWLHIWEDEYGEPTILSDMDQDYIDWAQSEGYQVWVMLENVDNTFSNIDNHLYEMLSVTETRQALVQQLLVWYQEYGFDGINIDFEGLETRVGPYYVQFMRELSAVLRPQGCVVSTDIGVPSAWTEHYGRDVLGEVCDYICLMAYDEHYTGDTTAGSVASYPWVLDGVLNSLNEGIPAEKLVLCVPLYSRIWWLNSNGEVMEDWSNGMSEVWEDMEDYGAQITWDADAGQYRAEHVFSDGSRYITWLEDTKSMQMRFDLALEQKLGGIALWRQEWETDELYDQIREYRAAAGAAIDPIEE